MVEIEEWSIKCLLHTLQKDRSEDLWGINFKEEVKALVLLSSLPTSWEVTFCTTFANSCPKLNLDETISQVLTEDIRRKLMGLTIDESVEAHYSIESIGRSNQSKEQT